MNALALEASLFSSLEICFNAFNEGPNGREVAFPFFHMSHVRTLFEEHPEYAKAPLADS